MDAQVVDMDVIGIEELAVIDEANGIALASEQEILEEELRAFLWGEVGTAKDRVRLLRAMLRDGLHAEDLADEAALWSRMQQFALFGWYEVRRRLAASHRIR